MTGMDLIRTQRGLISWLALRLGLSQAAVSSWRRIPAERARDIENITGIPRHLLRPDLWTPPWKEEAEKQGIRNIINKRSDRLSAEA